MVILPLTKVQAPFAARSHIRAASPPSAPTPLYTDVSRKLDVTRFRFEKETNHNQSAAVVHMISALFASIVPKPG